MEQTILAPESNESNELALATFGGVPAVIDRMGAMHRIDQWQSMSGSVHTDNIYSLGGYRSLGHSSFYSSLIDLAHNPEDENFKSLKDYGEGVERWIEKELERASIFDPEVTRLFTMTTTTNEIYVDESSPQWVVINDLISPNWEKLEEKNLDRRYRQVAKFVSEALEARMHWKQQMTTAKKIRKEWKEASKSDKVEKPTPPKWWMRLLGVKRVDYTAE